MTGFTPEQRAATITRDGGICTLAGFVLGCTHRATEANHRLNRMMGGSKLRNGMSNAAAICNPCNIAIESDAAARTIAIAHGVKVAEGSDPALTPMWSSFFAQWTQPGDENMSLLGGRLDEGMPS